MARFRPVDHKDELSLVEHLDELRSRLVVTGICVGVALALCFWQNHLILAIANAPLGRRPVALSPTEPFLTTLTLSAYAALLITMPVLLYQLYAFVLPAFSPTERRVALPMLLMVPVLFIAGVAFGYFVILPKALQFLLSFNADVFEQQIRARDYYSFAAMSLFAVGVLFQIPVGVLAAVRLGLTTPRKLRKNRRYAILVIAILAMLLPGQDPITMTIAMVPLIVLYEASILLASAFGRPPADVRDTASAEGS